MDIKKNDNKSLVLYTSLIFAAAIIMIVISFFAQRHLEQLKVSETEAENVTLSSKAALVSEENMQLVELNKALKTTNTQLTEENQTLTGEKEQLSKEVSKYKELIDVYNHIIKGQKNTAKNLLKEIFTEDLSQDQKDIYDFLAKELQ